MVLGFNSVSRAVNRLGSQGVNCNRLHDKIARKRHASCFKGTTSTGIAIHAATGTTSPGLSASMNTSPHAPLSF